MNPQRDRGIRAEREACVLLSAALDLDVRRRANEGIREDIGDLVGVPDTTIQVSAVPDDPTKIGARAQQKAAGCAVQQARAGTTHGVVLLRIDGGHWRAVCSGDQLEALGWAGLPAPSGMRPGLIVRWAPMFAAGTWTLSHPAASAGGLFAAGLDGWADCWLAGS